MPKEIRVEPQKFAAELIHRLEAIQRTREAEEKLEERLKRVRMVSGPMSGWPLGGLAAARLSSGQCQAPGAPSRASQTNLSLFSHALTLSPVTHAPSKPPLLVPSLCCLPGSVV